MRGTVGIDYVYIQALHGLSDDQKFTLAVTLTHYKSILEGVARVKEWLAATPNEDAQYVADGLEHPMDVNLINLVLAELSPRT